MEEATAAGDTRRPAVIGAILGLLGAAALGLLQLLGDDGPMTAERLFGGTVFTLLYTSPYLLTLLAGRVAQPAARGGLLMALGTVSLIASFAAFSLITVILLPATVAIFIAGARSLRAPASRLVLVIPFYALGMIYGAVMVLSFIALFAFEANEARCWTLTRNEDGTEQWSSRPYEEGGLTLASGQGEIRAICTSDIITISEAAKSASILSVGAVLFVGTTRLRLASP